MKTCSRRPFKRKDGLGKIEPQPQKVVTVKLTPGPEFGATKTQIFLAESWLLLKTKEATEDRFLPFSVCKVTWLPKLNNVSKFT